MSTPTRSDPLFFLSSARSLSLSLSQRCAARPIGSQLRANRLVQAQTRKHDSKKERAPRRESSHPRVKISFEVGDSHPEEDRATASSCDWSPLCPIPMLRLQATCVVVFATMPPVLLYFNLI